MHLFSLMIFASSTLKSFKSGNLEISVNLKMSKDNF